MDRKVPTRLQRWLAACAVVASSAIASAATVAPPPPSLAKLYPPKAAEKVYAKEMLELGRLFGTVSSDVADGSTHAAQSVEEFGRQYGKMQAMVPEWKGYFPPVPFDELRAGANTAAGREKLKGALVQIEKSCTNCHAAEMFKVQATYHWPRFSQVRVADEAGRAVAFHDTMVALSNEMAAVPELVKRGDWLSVDAHQTALRRNFDLLERSCDACHEVSREYFVDKTVKARVLKLGGLSRAKSGTPSEYSALMNEITTTSCIPCHQVHMPAAYLQVLLDQ